MTSAAVCVSKLRFSRSRFTGKERDSESGNDYFGARYFASSMGRFMSPDTQDPSDALPFVGIDPIPYADPANPQSFNLYSYVHNNPLTNTDPDGHDCINTSNLQTNGTVTVTSGTSCASDPAKYGTYVDGTVDTKSLTVNSQGDLGYSFSNYADGSGSSGSGIISSPTPYGPLEGPANQQGVATLSAAYNLFNNVTGGVEITAGALVAGAVGAGPVADLIAAQRYRAALAAWKALSAATGAAGLINKFFKTGEVPPRLTPEMMSAYLNLAKTYISAGLGTAGGIMQSGIGTQANRIQQLENYLGR